MPVMAGEPPGKELIGARIWRVMRERGIGPSELARRLEVTPSTVSHWFAGRSIPRDTNRIHQLVEALGVNVEKIYGSSADAEAELEWLQGIKEQLTPDEAQEYLQRLAAADHAANLRHLRKTQQDS